MTYSEEEYLLLSGIQHFAFCRRQWALIHIEQQWAENLWTAEGKIVHERCHDEQFTQKRKDVLVSRGMRVVSHRLGVTGQCDVVVFETATRGCVLQGREGIWSVYPIEYKRGKEKSDAIDILQLCGQAICLEEMLSCPIEKGALFYHETHRRQEVEFSPTLRRQVVDMLREMHEYFRRSYTPKVKTTKKCQSCSLKEVCVPRLCKNLSAADYYDKQLEEI